MEADYDRYTSSVNRDGVPWRVISSRLGLRFGYLQTALRDELFWKRQLLPGQVNRQVRSWRSSLIGRGRRNGDLFSLPKLARRCFSITPTLCWLMAFGGPRNRFDARPQCSS